MSSDNTSCDGAIKTTLEVVGDKYTARVLQILEDGDKRFKDFEAAIPEISSRTLTSRLQKLLDMSIIEKITCPSSPGRQSYQLTSSGKELQTVILAMENWGRANLT